VSFRPSVVSFRPKGEILQPFLHLILPNGLFGFIPDCPLGSNPSQPPPLRQAQDRLIRGGASFALPLKWGRQAIRAADARTRGSWRGFGSNGSSGFIAPYLHELQTSSKTRAIGIVSSTDSNTQLSPPVKSRNSQSPSGCRRKLSTPLRSTSTKTYSSRLSILR